FALSATATGGPSANFWGRTEVAVGDFSGDGVSDVVVSGLYPNGMRVAGFDGKSLRGGGTPKALFTPFVLSGKGYENGSFLAAGDVNGDGFADVVLAAHEWSTPRIQILSGKSLVQKRTREVLVDFAPGGTEFGFGIRVALRDLNCDGVPDLVIGAG